MSNQVINNTLCNQCIKEAPKGLCLNLFLTHQTEAENTRKSGDRRVRSIIEATFNTDDWDFLARHQW